MWCLSCVLCSASAEARPQGAISEEESDKEWFQSKDTHCSDQITECHAPQLTPCIIGADVTNPHSMPGTDHSLDANSKLGHNKKRVVIFGCWLHRMSSNESKVCSKPLRRTLVTTSC